MHKYDVEIDPSNPNNSHAFIVDLVGANKRVLDVGCSTGYVASALRARGCVVSGLEGDPEAAEAARPHLDTLVVGDLEVVDLVEAFGPRSFDAVVFGDVLEHVREPLDVLRRSRPLLVEGGSVVASIPNIAHGSVRLALMQGRFDYQPLGLLDSTHLRFFTRDSLEKLFRDAGLVVVEMRRTTAGLFGTHIPLEEDDFRPELVESVLDDPESLTYQFVLRAIPDDAGFAVTQLHEREEAQHLRIAELERSLATAERAHRGSEAHVEELEKQVVDLERRLDDLTEQLDRTGAELGRVLATRTMRYTRVARKVYSRARDLLA